VLLSKLLNPNISLLSYVLCSGSKVKITERLEYRLPSLTCKVLITTQPSYLHELIAVQPPRSTHSPSVVTLARPPTSPSLRITDCTFRLFHIVSETSSVSLRQPHPSLSISHSPLPTPVTSFSYVDSSLSSSITPRSVTHLFQKSFLPYTLFSVRIESTDYLSLGSFLLSYIGFVFCSFSIFFLCVWFSAV